MIPTPTFKNFTPKVIAAILLLMSCSAFAQNQSTDTMEKKEIAFLLFDNYETLDVFGPAEIFGRLTDHYILRFYSLKGGVVTNRHRVPIMTEKLSTINKKPFAFLIPGGLGTRIEVKNEVLINKIKEVSLSSDYVLTVCTGSALLAKSGLLDDRKATSNKRAFSWVMTNGQEVEWDKKARWKVDGNYYTSSGVSAGMDMALGFLADRHGIDFAKNVAWEIEYNWIEDKDNDTFTAE
ncbi:DJ-1/PfpI family protein [Maribacter sp. MAR_2009_72]|uniref:DJ-1/PfpI family protein n=1 Tax=Maribacter sp. MAR_2009_72 TaxID=1250050 RepID=UPI0011999E96|nr:DJ-1/PfpI family protein [Maribacter sp. MAR_2009_72]TVZ14194.1 DJ-1/PfpI family protein [Maribacter sp. MAR_2009_72]